MRDMPPLVVGGLTPFTTIDFPGHLAAVVFCQGCPWRCGYCHNPHLIPRDAAPSGAPTWDAVLAWLETRRGLLDGVVFSGGEPLLQRGLPQALAEVRALGFATALHTGGAYPERLRAVLPLLDWVGFDVKAPFGDYAAITGAGGGAEAQASLALLIESGVAHEVRSTIDPVQQDAARVGRMAGQVKAMGEQRIVLQPCRIDGQRMHFPRQAMLDAVAQAGLAGEVRGE